MANRLIQDLGFLPITRLPSEQEKAKVIKAGVKENSMTTAAKDDYRSLNSWGIAAFELSFEISELLERINSLRTPIPGKKTLASGDATSRDIAALRKENALLSDYNRSLQVANMFMISTIAPQFIYQLIEEEATPKAAADAMKLYLVTSLGGSKQ